jgi:hypothetical protein
MEFSSWFSIERENDVLQNMFEAVNLYLNEEEINKQAMNAQFSQLFGFKHDWVGTAQYFSQKHTHGFGPEPNSAEFQDLLTDVLSHIYMCLTNPNAECGDGDNFKRGLEYIKSKKGASFGKILPPDLQKQAMAYFRTAVINRARNRGEAIANFKNSGGIGGENEKGKWRAWVPKSHGKEVYDIHGKESPEIADPNANNPNARIGNTIEDAPLESNTTFYNEILKQLDVLAQQSPRAKPRLELAKKVLPERAKNKSITELIKMFKLPNQSMARVLQDIQSADALGLEVLANKMRYAQQSYKVKKAEPNLGKISGLEQETKTKQRRKAL